MKKFFAAAFVFILVFVMIALIDGWSITSTPEGTFLTREYVSPWVEVSTGEGGDRVCMSVDRSGKIRKVNWESYSNLTDNSYDCPYWIVYEMKADSSQGTATLEDPWIQRLLENYDKAGGPKF